MLTTQEAADYARVSVHAIRGMIKRGILSAYRPGGKILLIKKSDIVKVIEKAKVEA